MKVILFLCLVSFAYAELLTPEEAYQEVEAYIIEKSLSLPHFRGSLTTMQCYDKYMPQISQAAENSKSDSSTCISDANEAKDLELKQVEGEREKLNADVKKVQDALAKCVSEANILDYLKCLTDTAAENKEIIDSIASLSSQITAKISESFEQIERTQRVCVTGAIDEAKRQTDALFTALENCLLNGEDDETTTEAPEPTTEPTTESTTESEPDSTTAQETETTINPEAETEPTSAPISNPQPNPNTENLEKNPEDDIYDSFVY